MGKWRYPLLGGRAPQKRGENEAHALDILILSSLLGMKGDVLFGMCAC